MALGSLGSLLGYFVALAPFIAKLRSYVGAGVFLGAQVRT